MTWPIGTPVSRAGQRLDTDIADLARESTQLKRENADLRRQLQTAQHAAEYAESALAISREAHAALLAQNAQLERIAASVKQAAINTPHWPVGRWVKFGPMAALLQNKKDL